MALLACELGFDAIDINMGCPSHSIVHRGAGAGLIRTPQVAQAIVAATKAGVDDWCNGRSLADDPAVPRRFVTRVAARRAALPAAYQVRRALPVSVKTRIGYEMPEVDEWIPRLLESEPVAIAIHGRTLRQAYTGSADWEAIGHAAELARGSATLMLGNGDVESRDDAEARARAYGLDGVLIGRGSYGNPFIFSDRGAPPQNGPDPARSHLRMQIALEHAWLYEETFRDLPRYRFIPMRKHLNWYVRGVHSAAHIRQALMRTSSPQEAEAVLRPYLSQALRYMPDPLPRWLQPAPVVD
jgi:tRNA-dihydrouridine synthase